MSTQNTSNDEARETPNWWDGWVMGVANTINATPAECPVYFPEDMESAVGRHNASGADPQLWIEVTRGPGDPWAIIGAVGEHDQPENAIVPKASA